MSSQLDLCNLALDAIGTRSTIASLSEGSAESNACSRQYTPALSAVLAAHNWDFARQQSTLALLNDATQGQSVPSPWLYEYAPPSDLIRMRYIMPLFNALPGSNPSGTSVALYSGPPVRFVMSSDYDANGNNINVILTNQNQAIAVYTKNVTNTLLFSPEFIRAFALYLGHMIAIPLTGDKQLAKGLFDESTQLIRDAAASNQNEGLTVNESIPDWMRVRGYASDWAYPAGSLTYYGPDAMGSVS